MPTYHTFLHPSLTPNAVLDISLPTHWNPSSSTGSKSVADKSIVRQFELGAWKEEAPLGLIRKLAVRDGIVALADSTNRITLAKLPNPPKAPTLPADGVVDETNPALNADEEDEDEDDEDLKIVDQFKVKGKKKGDSWVGLEMVDSGILSTTSSGLVTLNPHSSISSTTNSSSTKTAKLPSGLKTAQSLGSSGEKIVVAGKEVDVSIFDTERVFTAGSDGADGVNAAGGKRKKGEMEVGEIWRAKGLPNNHLSLRVPIHHLCMTLLPSSPSESNSTTTSIVTGTKSGHVRRYDTRQRKPVDGWKVAREGGIGAVSAGENEHELFFADTSSFLGSMDLRTGKLLYAYAAQTSTPHVLFPLPSNPTSSSSSTSASAFTASKSKSEKNRIGLVTLSSDYTLRACSTTAPPADKRRNVAKGDVLGMIGGVGSGSVGYYGVMERDEGEDEEDEGEEGEFGVGSDEDEEVWDDMDVVRDDGEEEEDDEDDESEEESEAEGAKNGKRTRRG